MVVTVQARDRLVALNLARQRMLNTGAYEWMPVFQSVADLLPISVLICDMRVPHGPIMYANRHFFTLTGYEPYEVYGRNCKFLQGKGTEEAAIETLRRAIRERREAHVQLLNYRKDGTPFVNRLAIKPVFEGHRRPRSRSSSSTPSPIHAANTATRTESSPLDIGAASPMYFPRSPLPAWMKAASERRLSIATTVTAPSGESHAASGPASHTHGHHDLHIHSASNITVTTTALLPKRDDLLEEPAPRLLFYIGVQQEVAVDGADDPSLSAKHTAIFDLLPSTVSL